MTRFSLFAAFFLGPGLAFGQELVLGQPNALQFTSIQCPELEPCELHHPTGEYVISGERLANRTRSGRSSEIMENEESLLAGSLSAEGNVIAAAIQKVSRSRRAFSRGVHPDDLDRTYRVALINPRSTSLIKSIDLATFKPESISIANNGEVLFVAGRDVEDSSRKMVRAFNARSGAEVFSRQIDDPDDVRLAANGFRTPAAIWTIATASASDRKVYVSRDPFSIAEYEVNCSDQIAAPRERGVGVAPFSDAATSQDEILAEALASELASTGMKVVERARLKEVLEEIQLSTSGLTDSELAVDVGELGIAGALVFGTLERIDQNINGNFRAVDVETGNLASSCTMICRDCQDQDLYEGVIAVASHWSGQG